MAVWRRKPTHRVLIQSDQGSRFNSVDWAAFVRSHNLEHSMSGSGNCHPNAVAESFFSSLRHERIRRRTHKTREEVRQDMFDYMEMFYNPLRKQARKSIANGKPGIDIAIPSFRYKSSISICRTFGFIRECKVTDCARFDGRMLREIVIYDNTASEV